MSNNKLCNAINFRPTKDQKRALDKLEKINFKCSEVIRIAIDEYLYRNFRKMLTDFNKIKTPF